jgi:hypothetical protein
MTDPLRRPNHYFNDSLGDPATCTGDHNHPEPTVQGGPYDGLPQSVYDRASSAHCIRCKVRLLESPAVTGTVMVQYYVPALGVKQRGFLCGACGLDFRQFLMPELAEDQTFQAVVAELRSRWT